jgi:hypothetical protein
MENKQTAVEWFIEQLKNQGVQYIRISEQAKKMEREQIKEMYLKGIANYDPTFKIKESKRGN